MMGTEADISNLLQRLKAAKRNDHGAIDTAVHFMAPEQRL